MKDFEYTAPQTLREAVKLLADKGDAARVLAGGTDLIVQMRGRRHQPERVVDIKNIAEANELGFTPRKGLRIGAAVPCHLIYHNEDVAERFTALVDSSMIVGGIQIQGRATLGGNLCNASPAADGVPALLTLGAEVEICAQRGSRVVPLAAFIRGPRQVDLAPDEMVSALLIPALSADARGGFVKLGSRRHMVISIAMVAVLAEVAGGRLGDLRIAVGSCAPVATRLPALEARLAGLSRAEVQAADLADPAALAPLSPITDVRGTAEYRHAVVAELCRRAVLQAGGEW